jgi:acetyl-CoA carboxylase carboxyl transferase subunit alpha
VSRAGTVERAAHEAEVIAAVDLSRHPHRPRSLDVLAQSFSDWTELHGDRLFGDDRAVVGGPAMLDGEWVMVIAQEKGSDVASRAERNFGMPHPEGYRKAQRLLKLADKFRMPVVCFVDTPAAHPGVGAEERGQAWAIAASLLAMLQTRVPIVSVVLSEGGSGGALALAMGDVVIALEHAIYSVAPPETCAAILYRDGKQRARAALALRPGVDTAMRVGLVDEIVPEPAPGAHAHRDVVIAALTGAIRRHLAILRPLTPAELRERRSRRYRLAGDTGASTGARGA